MRGFRREWRYPVYLLPHLSNGALSGKKITQLLDLPQPKTARVIGFEPGRPFTALRASKAAAMSSVSRGGQHKMTGAMIKCSTCNVYISMRSTLQYCESPSRQAEQIIKYFCGADLRRHRKVRKLSAYQLHLLPLISLAQRKREPHPESCRR